LTWAGPEEVRYSLINLLALRIVIGTNPCCAAIAPAHELIHRRSPVQRLIGRVMLLTVCYDHFWIAHRVGHHARLGSSLDPSTALGHEGFEEFFRKSVTRQWQVAWRYGSAPMLVGLTLELGLLVGFAVAFGGLAAMFLAYQSLLAVRLLETVNYFQHFGLTRDSTRSGATAWRCDSAVSLFLFLGLPRHADHHRRPAVPFTDLEATDRGPHLPCGYLWAAIWVRNANRSYRTWASAHLASEGAA
jgi:alkane 1-monooxygenase